MGPADKKKATRFTTAEQRFDPESTLVHQVRLFGSEQFRNRAHHIASPASVDRQGQTREAMLLHEADLLLVAHLASRADRWYPPIRRRAADFGSLVVRTRQFPRT